MTSDESNSEKGEEGEVPVVPKWTNLPTVDFRSLQHKTLGQILVETKRITEMLSGQAYIE